MLSEYSRLLDCRRINLRIFLAFRILHQAFCAKSFGDSVRRIAGISKFVQYCTLTYSPWLKPGDSWIPTAFAYETIGLTMPLQRRSMPQPSRCSLQRSCPDHAQYRNTGTSTLGRANLSLRDSAHRRYDRSASLRSTGRPFGLLFPSYSLGTLRWTQTRRSRSPILSCPIASAYPSGSGPRCTQARTPRRLRSPAFDILPRINSRDSKIDKDSRTRPVLRLLP